MQIDLVKSTVANLGTGKSVPCDPVSDYMMQILEAGGIKKMMIEQNMKEIR